MRLCSPCAAVDLPAIRVKLTSAVATESCLYWPAGARYWEARCQACNKRYYANQDKKAVLRVARRMGLRVAL